MGDSLHPGDIHELREPLPDAGGGRGRISFLRIRILLPTFIDAIPVVDRIFSLVDICFIFRDDRRCIHDLIADTVVVKA